MLYLGPDATELEVNLQQVRISSGMIQALETVRSV